MQTRKTAKAAIDELFANGFTEVNTSFKPDKVVVAVNAPFGEGAKAAKILDSYATVATTDEELGAREPEGSGSGRASPSISRLP